jgi:hypothetical protein
VYPNIKVYWYGPTNSIEAQFDPSDTCTIDAYEVHIYIYGDNQPNRTGKGDWNGGTPFSCGPSGGANGTLPHDVQCAPSTGLGFFQNYVTQSPHIKPIAITEWCDGYNDATGPGGVSYAAWAILNWAKFTNTISMQSWSGDPSGAGQSTCTVTGHTNVQAAFNAVIGGSHYGGTFFTYKTLPVPYPYP